MKALIGGIIGALVVAGLVVSLNAQRIPALQASGFEALRGTSLDPASDGVLLNCGEGRQALVRPVAAGQRFSQVECVATQSSATQSNVLMTPAVMPAVQTFAAQPVVQPLVYQERPVTRVRTSTSTPVRYREPVKQGRTWKKSALIIGGSAAGGAGLGAIMGGGNGAKKGAIVGGVGGLVYDLATRNR